MKRTMILLMAVLAVAGLAAIPPADSQLAIRNFFDGSNNLAYVCIAAQNQAKTTWAISDASLTSIVVSTNVATVTVGSASGVYVGMRVVVSGSTTSAVNGSFTVSSDTPTGTTFTYPVTVADGTYNNAALILTTSWPLDNASVWKVLALRWSGSNNTNVVEGGTESATYTQKCSLRANY